MSVVHSYEVPFADTKRIYICKDRASKNYFCSAEGVPIRPGFRTECQYISSVIEKEGEDDGDTLHLPSIEIAHPVKVDYVDNAFWRITIAGLRATNDAIYKLLSVMEEVGLMRPHRNMCEKYRLAPQEEQTDFPPLEVAYETVAIPSSRSDHFHLFIRKQLRLEEYKKLLQALFDAKVIEKKFFELFARNGFTLVDLA